MRVRANAVGPIGQPLEELLTRLETLARRHDDDAVRDLLRGVAALSRPTSQATSNTPDVAAAAAHRAPQAGDR
jgi:hypothetical protein